MLLVEDSQEKSGGNQEEEIAKLNSMVKKLRKRYKAAKLEIEDCTKEFATQKQELLDIVRFQEKDMKFSDKLIEIMLSKSELYKLR